MKLNKLFITAAVALTAMPMAARMPEASDLRVRDINVERVGNQLNIAFTVDCTGMPVTQNVETKVTPVLASPAGKEEMGSFTIAGRNRYIMAKRNGVTKNSGNTYYKSGTQQVNYNANLIWEPWMENAGLDLVVENLGCCRSVSSTGDLGLARLNMGPRSFDAPMYYITPVEEKVKMRDARGEAYIDFKVNQTAILPEYRNNTAEIKKIRATIDSIKADPDTKITTLTITGYASPEGGYANNERLAKGRTAALADYVRKLYTFPANLMKTSWVAEDWDGLRVRVARSSLTNKEGILRVIDSNLAPDAKEAKIRADFPTQYAYMLQNFYPALRHSDYVVAFEVRKYSDPVEIAKVMKQNPAKLSLRELFILAETLKPGTEEYAEVWRTAVRYFPEDATANLNAANSALTRGDLKAAAAFLDKAGDTPEAIYARGVLAAKQGEYDKARIYFDTASRKGLDVKAALDALAKASAPQVVYLSE